MYINFKLRRVKEKEREKLQETRPFSGRNLIINILTNTCYLCRVLIKHKTENILQKKKKMSFLALYITQKTESESTELSVCQIKIIISPFSLTSF